jgi:hypothetical protein
MPPDSPGDFKNWTHRSGYVGSLDAVVCETGKEGLLCKTTDNHYGVCRRLTQSPTGSSGQVSCVQPGPNEPQNDKDCAQSCSGNQGWRAMFHAKESARSNAGDDPVFDSNICLCYGEPKTEWDRCVLDKDDKGWTLWSSPEHQKDCDSSGVYTVKDIIKGVDGVTPTDAVYVPNEEACSVEVKGRWQSDQLAYAVFDAKYNVCYLKTDDPNVNPFHDCITDMMKTDHPNQFVLLSKDSDIDRLKENTTCPQVTPITYYGQLPDYYLRKQTATGLSTTASAADCAAACAVVDNGGPQVYDFPLYSRPAFTWEGDTCNCYDFPGVDNSSKGKTAADVWRCAYWTGDKPAGKQLYVRTENHLRPFDDLTILKNIKELDNCNHDGSKAPIYLGTDPTVKCRDGSDPVCNQQYDGTDEGHYFCTYSAQNWTPQSNNAFNCAKACKADANPEICVDNAAAECGFSRFCNEMPCNPGDDECDPPLALTQARCKPWRGIQGSPCKDNSDCAANSNLQCLPFPQNDPKNRKQCKLCQIPG